MSRTTPASRVAPRAASPAAGVVAPRLVRHRSGRMVAGVAAGVAEHLDLPVQRVRAAFILFTALSGTGLLAYGLAWIFVPQESSGPAREVTARQRSQALGLAAVGLGLAVAASAAGNSVLGWVAGPLGVVALGVGMVWREADETRRRRWVAAGRGGLFGRGGKVAAFRLLSGALLVTCGLGVFLLGRLDLDQLRFGLLAVLATVAGVAVLTVPFWVRLSRELREERRERIRHTELADIATHLHDSVLQTLALIQRQADEPREVRRLARGQERELRAWLYGPTGHGPTGRGPRGVGPPPWTAAVPGGPGGAVPGGAVPADTVVGGGVPGGGVPGGGVPGGGVPGGGVPGGAVPGGAVPGGAGTLAEAVTRAAAEVEDTYAVAVRPVVVGDRALDERLSALVAAGREAMVNAAKHAEVAEISLYTEVEAAAAHLFVRDRGVGFDPSAVPADRHGLADSVHGRMRRHGGRVEVRTAPGAGTEVRLEMPLTPVPGSGTDEEQ